MCGIFGVLVGKNSNFTPSLIKPTIKYLFRLSESRGKEAAGIAVFFRQNDKCLQRAYFRFFYDLYQNV